jgi:hypothetical protein
MKFYYYNHIDNQIQEATRDLAHKLGFGDYIIFLVDILSRTKIDDSIKVLVGVTTVKQDYTIANDSDIDLVMLSRCDHSYGVYDLAQLRSSIGNPLKKPLLVLDGNTSREYETDQVIFCPLWAMMYPFRFIVPVLSNEPGEKKYMFSCLSNKPRNDRLMNLTRMLEQPEKFIPGKTIITMGHDFFDGITLTEQSVEYASARIRAAWSPETQAVFDSKVVPSIPLTHPDIPPPRYDPNDVLGYHNAAYYDSYVNIVTEYDAESSSPFFSEKSMKPILAEQLFVVLGSPGTVSLLRRLGFDMFDDIFDHESYDHLPQAHQRIDAMHRAIPTYTMDEWARVYQETAARRTANRKLLLFRGIEGNFLDRLTAMVKRKLQL